RGAPHRVVHDVDAEIHARREWAAQRDHVRVDLVAVGAADGELARVDRILGVVRVAVVDRPALLLRLSEAGQAPAATSRAAPRPAVLSPGIPHQLQPHPPPPASAPPAVAPSLLKKTWP